MWHASWLLCLAIASPNDDPRITSVSLAAPNVLAVQIEHGRVVVPPAFDAPLEGELTDRWVNEDGRVVATRIGPKGDRIQPVETLLGSAWDPALADEPSEWNLTVDRTQVTPLRIGRKSQPKDLARVGGWDFVAAMEHRLYLVLPEPPRQGAALRVEVPGAGAWEGRIDTRRMRTEGLRVHQTGFRPDDPSKSALYTLWMGSLGVTEFVPDRFELLDARTNRVVFQGRAELHNDGTRLEHSVFQLNSVAPVYLLDFSEFRTPGTYRIHLPGLGSSFEFPIAERAWYDIFRIAAKAFYFQRNGIPHEARFGPYVAPRAFHPDDGQRVYHSTTSIMDSGNGLNALGTDRDNFGNLVAGATDQLVANAWGGYKDAGDWDTRVQHLEATMQLLELAERFPAEVARLRLNIPESGGPLPDLIDEARWNIDHYKRMQTPEGGIRGGLEFEEHPFFGETSWTNHLRKFAYAPDPWSSWLYAATAARFAYVVGPIDPAMRAEYGRSAVAAFDWGVAELARLNRASFPHQVRDARNLAAVELLRLTGDPRFEREFRETSTFLDGGPVWQWGVTDQGEAAAVLLRFPTRREAANRPSDIQTTVGGAVVADSVHGGGAVGSVTVGSRSTGVTGTLTVGTGRRPTLGGWITLGTGAGRQPDGADESSAPADAREAARSAILSIANRTLSLVRTTTFRFGHIDPFAYPGYSHDVNAAGKRYLLWAHAETGQERYLEGLINASGFALGVNPTNRVFVSGVGSNPVRLPFMVDPRTSGQPFPPGITVYGPMTYKNEGQGPWFGVVRPFVYPALSKWPGMETHFDCYWAIMMNEFTIMQSLGPTAHVWGYLAFRKP